MYVYLYILVDYILPAEFPLNARLHNFSFTLISGKEILCK